MLHSPGIKSVRNSVLNSQLFLGEDNTARQAVWHLEFVRAPALLGFFCRSLGFCRGPRKLYLMTQYLGCTLEEN